MKKISIVSALLMLLGLTAAAQESVSVGEVLVPQGRQTMMEVMFHFNEGHDYVSYQFTVRLPQGISLVTDGDGVVPVTLGDGQPANIFKGLDLDAGSHILTCYSNPSTRIVGTEGVLVRIPIEADDDLEAGTELSGSLTEVYFASIDAVSHTFPNASFSIKVTDEIILDENSPIAPESTSGTAWNVRVKRTIKAGEWSTLCLPFDMTEGDFKNIFGNDVQLAYFTGYEAEKKGTDVTGLTINFEDDDLSEGFSGNYPYLIKTSKDITEFTINTTIDPDDVEEDYKQGKKVVGKFIGTYQAGTVVPENSLFLSGNKFWYSAGKTKMKGFRAYFTLNDVLAEATQAGARIVLHIGDETTGLVNVNDNENDNRRYDLLGRSVEHPSKKGVYIRNGKKEVVK